MQDNPVNICFDINGVLLDWNDQPIQSALDTLRYLSRLRNVQICVWSARGKDYADYIVDEVLRIRDLVWQSCGKEDKDRPPCDIAFDDQITASFGHFNLITKAPTWKKPRPSSIQRG